MASQKGFHCSGIHQDFEQSKQKLDVRLNSTLKELHNPQRLCVISYCNQSDASHNRNHVVSLRRDIGKERNEAQESHKMILLDYIYVPYGTGWVQKQNMNTNSLTNF